MRLAALASGGFALSSCEPSDRALTPARQKADGLQKIDGPFCLSTWRHGLAANEAAWSMLSRGGMALDAVEAGVRITEADLSNRTVGLGGMPDRKGRVTLDASIMDHDGRCGAVAALEHIDHPISVARKVMEESPHVMLVGEGAYDFALSQGFERSRIEVPVPEAAAKYRKLLEENAYEVEINAENHDTIGMLAMDRQSRMGGACTTSGLSFKMHGRVGDSPIIGAGLFIDSEVGAVTASGLGEAIIRASGSSAVLEAMRRGAHPQEACMEVLERILRKQGSEQEIQVAFIAIDAQGHYGAGSILPGFEYALQSESLAELYQAEHLKKR